MDIDRMIEIVPLLLSLAPGFIIIFFRNQFISGRMPNFR